MSYRLLDGKKLAEELKTEIKTEVDALRQAGSRPPHLAAILVGNDGGSEAYVGHKVKACSQAGFESTLLRFPESVTEQELLDEVNLLNNNAAIDGYIVQLPLPKHIDSQKILLAISPGKDVDGFHPLNVGRLTLGMKTYVSATPLGIMTLLKRNDIELSGKHAVVIGRSNIVGRPLSILLSQANATVTVCHSHTSNLTGIAQQADILIAALGRPGFVNAAMVKPGAVVIDVGTTRIADTSTKSGFRLCGDVKFDEVAPLCSFITPVPGGVGPMTVVSLLLNTLQAAKSRS